MARERKKKQTAQPGKIDWEALGLSFGLGSVMILVGAVLGWATWTAPAGGGTAPRTATQAAVSLLPDTVKGWIALALAGGFVLFGALLFVMGFIKLVKDLFSRETQ